MAYWWVNQGQTYEQERAGGYLWSPKRAKDGTRRRFYDAMRDAAVDDLVVHYVSKPYGAVISASVVEAPARSEAQPPELRHTKLWNDDGWLLPVVYVEDVRPVPKRDALALGPHEQPFTQTGTVNQGYLYPLTDKFGERLLAALDPVDIAGASSHPDSTGGEVGPETAPLEQGRRLTFDQVVTPGRRAAARAEWRLVARLVADFGLAETRRRYPLPNGTELSADLWVEATRLLVEAKASAGRSAVRQAIGQLYDYADKEPQPVTKMLVVPERPADDLLDVLRSADIRAVWLNDDEWDGDFDGSLWGTPHRDL